MTYVPYVRTIEHVVIPEHLDVVDSWDCVPLVLVGLS